MNQKLYFEELYVLKMGVGEGTLFMAVGIL